MTIHTLAADLADRIPGMQVDGKTNVIETLLRPVFTELTDTKILLREKDVTATTFMNQVKKLHILAGFLSSVIRSGEPWTETCQAEFDKAIPPIK